MTIHISAPKRAHTLNANPTRFVTRDITGTLVVLGSGTSVGVPAIGCGCEVCRSSDARNKRMRCAVVFGLPQGNLLIDTPPDLRSQLLREDIGIVHAVAFTHEHADHVFGLDDLRLFQFYLGRPVPLFCSHVVEDRIRRSFDYAFDDGTVTHPGATPQLEFHRLEPAQPRQILGECLTPVSLSHGPRFDVFGFRVGNVAYCTDTNGISEPSLSLLEGLDVLILDALRWKSHPTHLNIAQALQIVERLNPRQAYFTHINHDLEHYATNAQLPDGVELAYDGLTIPLT